MATEISAQPSAPVAETPDGPVTLASVESLEQTATENQRAAQDLAKQVEELRAAIQSIQTEAGSVLAQRKSEWAASPREALIEVALGMESVIAGLEENISRLAAQPHTGLKGLVLGLRDQHEINSLQAKLKSAKAELSARYRAVADQVSPPTGIADADSLLLQIQGDVLRSQALLDQKKALEDAIARLTDEINRRKAAISTVGFDAPAVEADLIANGLRPITANLVLKKGEIAVASVAATLCRYRTRTQYVGRSQGVSIPLGHGIRYRISGFRGNPIQVESLASVDQGSLVVTNQRVVFLGGKRDVSVPLVKLLQFEAFSNAVALGREGKETRDIYLVGHPAYVALYLQWVVAHQS